MSQPDDPLFVNLRQNSKTIAEKLLVPTSLVRAGQWLESVPELRSKFERAGKLYRLGSIGEALDAFLAVSQESEAVRIGGGLTAHLNAAACAGAVRDYSRVVELLEPIFQQGRLFGHPLWNLLVAFYKLGNLSEVANGLSRWINSAPMPFRSRGLLLQSALSIELGEIERAGKSLAQALDIGREFVLMELEKSSARIAPAVLVGPGVQPRRHLKRIPFEIRKQLLTLVQPKRPERRPELALMLTSDEIEDFAEAIEDMAEGRNVQAHSVLLQIQNKHPQLHYLNLALAACELFADRTEVARDILLRTEESGYRMPGSAWWNLACSYIRLGDGDGALRALNACSETEYRTKGQLWIALSVLTSHNRRGVLQRGVTSRRPAPPDRPARATGAPSTLVETRIDALHKLLKPRTLTAAYKPDIGRLLARDKDAIESILREVRRLDVATAHSMLTPWVTRYPKVYTLKVHAASYAILAGNFVDALHYLQDAQELRPLDAISRTNLAFVCMKKGNYLGVTQALESGQADWTTGRGSFQEVIEARRMLIEARLTQTRAVAEQYQMLAELVLCCGLGDMEALQMVEASGPEPK